MESDEQIYNCFDKSFMKSPKNNKKKKESTKWKYNYLNSEVNRQIYSGLTINNSNLILMDSSPYLTATIPPNLYKGSTLNRFWYAFFEDEFQTDMELIDSGNFSEVKKAKFLEGKFLSKRRHPVSYAGLTVALKIPKKITLKWVQQQHHLSYEVSCTMLLHPCIVNYIGGVMLGRGQSERVGIVMEYIESNLRNSIKKDSRILNRKNQILIAKQIASGMNFLHSLNPSILHRDLRSPNILINQNLECRIADFGLAVNNTYGEINPILIYSQICPPEINYTLNQIDFTKKSDVYFYGWILIEMILLPKSSIEYNFEKIKEKFETEFGTIIYEEQYKHLILKCIQQDPDERFDFSEISLYLNSISQTEYDLELIAQKHLMNFLKQEIASGNITETTSDSLGRNLVSQCCIFGNVAMLEYLINCWGEGQLFIRDKFNTTLTHFAARNGHLNILQFLALKSFISNQRESRFNISPLDLAIATRHWDCVHFLIPYANQDALDSALLSSSSEGNLELVQKLIHQGANISHIVLDNGASSLDRAAYNGHVSVVKYLLEQGAQVNQARYDGSTPLWNASQEGQAEVVKLLIEYGAEIDKIREEYGDTALYMASQNGRTEVVKILLESGSNPNKARTDNQTSPLYIAAQNGHREIVELLIKNGANINEERTDDGSIALFISAWNGHKEIVDILIRSGANVNKSRNDGCTALYISCQENFYDIVQLLLSRGADPNKFLNGSGTTPLFIACQKGFLGITKLLLEYNANINQSRIADGATPFYVACQNGYKDIVELLVNAGVNINQERFDIGCTPLFIASQNGHKEIVSYLLSKGANPNKNRSDNGISPLYTAVQSGHKEVVEDLIKHGADINCACLQFGISPLHVACRLGKKNIVEILLQAGAKVNQTTKDESTPLFIACFEGHLEIVKLLLQYNANPKIYQHNKLNSSPLEFAKKRNWIEIVEIFENFKG